MIVNTNNGLKTKNLYLLWESRHTDELRRLLQLELWGSPLTFDLH